MISTRVVLSILVVTVCIAVVNGCYCSRRTYGRNNRQKFCKAEFVVKGKIIDISIKTPKVRYQVENMYNFKLREANTLYIFSTKNNCGQTLKKGEIYLLSGTKDNLGDLHTNQCWWNSVWTDIPLSTRQDLQSGKYARCYKST